MKISFTICSLNYLHQATALGFSLLKHNPDYTFVIGLVDKIDSRIDKSKLPPYIILEVDQVINHQALDDMVDRYNIIELNTSVKPYFFEYLFKKYDAESIVYFDPDIYIYNELSTINNLFESGYDLLVTPHSVSPKESGFLTDHAFIKVGIFNFGFVGFRNSEDSIKLIKWWQKRLFESGYINLPANLFVDQLWMNLSVCYINKCYIIKDVGHNMAPWNLHERKITGNDELISVNDTTPLTFFHFSGITDQNIFLKRHGDDMTFDERPDLRNIFNDYNKILKENHSSYFKNIRCIYKQNRKLSLVLRKFLIVLASKLVDYSRALQ